MASKQASEVSREGKKSASTATSEVDKITLEAYLGREKVHPGLVASFRAELKNSDALRNGLSENEWKQAIEAQSNRLYA